MEQFDFSFPKGTTHVMTVIALADEADPRRSQFKLLSDHTEYAYVQYSENGTWEVYDGAELNDEELAYIGESIEAHYKLLNIG
jgi:hypothetical protein